ncbi:hypothetical protein TKK_0010521 [Trichogramma kaykai]
MCDESAAATACTPPAQLPLIPATTQQQQQHEHQQPLPQLVHHSLHHVAAGENNKFDGTMLKFLTHKLRSHSLNDESNQKVDDDHDSGTESDDEFQNGNDVSDELDTAMDSLDEASTARDSAVPSEADLGQSPSSTTTTTPSSILNYHCTLPPRQPPMLQAACSSSSGCSSTETPVPFDLALLGSLQAADQHSSEEELEVINGPNKVGPTPAEVAASSSSSRQVVAPTPVRARPTTSAPEKRKWSEANQQQRSSCDEADVGTAYSAPVSRLGRETGSGSSDEEIQGLCYSRSGSAFSQPVQFRSSPPQDAHRPVRSLSPPPKLFHASASAAVAAISSSSNLHRPRSRPRPHHHQSQPNLEPHHHFSSHHSHSQRSHQQQQQHDEPVDMDVMPACSPRKRHRPPHKLPRPRLDFEKMQQLKTQAVTRWRHTSEHGGGSELSVGFCW